MQVESSACKQSAQKIFELKMDEVNQ